MTDGISHRLPSPGGIVPSVNNGYLGPLAPTDKIQTIGAQRSTAAFDASGAGYDPVTANFQSTAFRTSYLSANISGLLFC